MKKLFLCLLIVFTGATLVFFSCRKSEQVSMSEEASLYASKKWKGIQQDPDWKIIARYTMDLTDAVVKSNLPIENLDFSERTTFLRPGETLSDLERSRRHVEQAARRLVRRYDINLSEVCLPCIGGGKSEEKLKTLLTTFRANPGIYTSFQNTIFGNAESNVPVQTGLFIKCEIMCLIIIEKPVCWGNCIILLSPPVVKS